MKPEIKEKWIDALRNGTYTQCKGQLKKDSSFCCLGVLTDLYVMEVQGEWRIRTRDQHLKPTEKVQLENNACLSDPVKKWAGLDDNQDDPVFFAEVGEVHEYSAITANDDDGKSFAEIADLVEKHL